MKQQHNRFKHFITIFGMLLGIVTTGATAKAKVNSNQVQNNNPNYSTNQNLNKNSVQENDSTLINISQQNLNQSQQLSMGVSHPNTDRRISQSINNQSNQIKKNILMHFINNNVHKDIIKSSHSHKISNSMNNSNGHPIYHHHHKINHINKATKNKLNHQFKHRHHHKISNFINNSNYHSIYHHHHHSWFRDGLSRRNFNARKWISRHESGHRWNVLSYGHVCVGYFQLNPAYLGYKHGHINLNHKHQVKVADHYVRSRYGNWVNAKKFWKVHHWY